MSNDNIRIEYLGNVPLSDIPILSLLIISIIINTILYKILPFKLSPLIKSYIISTIHAIISVISVIIYFLKYEINLKKLNRLIGGGLNGTGDELMIYNICYTCGYLIYDLILMLINKSIRTNSSVFHHIIILFGFLNGLYSKVCHPCHFYFLFEELSTIPLNLKTIYYKNIFLHKIFSILFILLFILSRLIYGTIITIYAFKLLPKFLIITWNLNDINSFLSGIFQGILSIISRLLNIYWTYLIIRKIIIFLNKNDNQNKMK